MTAEPDLDVVGVGNALVDVIAIETEDFLAEHGLQKGSMQLIDAETAVRLYMAMGSAEETSGGSAANTLAGIASFGGRAGFVGRVHDDQLGEIFVHDIRSIGVEFPATPRADGSPTGRCLVVVTPDGERTLNTLLGAAGELTAEDVDPAFVARAQVTFLEGYLFDQAAAGEAFAVAARAAHAAGRRVALTLSDSSCVERFLEGFRRLVASEVDILFGNEAELCLLYGTDDVDAALDAAAADCPLVVATLGAAGAAVASGGDVVRVPAVPVARVIDTTGAGDLFAAGFLFGLTRGHDVRRCAELGALAAAEVISHLGARPERPLEELLPPGWN